MHTGQQPFIRQNPVIFNFIILRIEGTEYLASSETPTQSHDTNGKNFLFCFVFCSIFGRLTPFFLSHFGYVHLFFHSQRAGTKELENYGLKNLSPTLQKSLK